ncbi:kynureninase [Fulvivirgaceae bacterium PWU4]|uniref:Kynureninase n=1 Tax=Chryseosolibacter histidini TaxID=2782349 RepID=A0AAP2DRQ5_9BACT|nr:kynureninase [Chryseosolibacter histidini]MBT1701270.1 kynureninase [Chryseosolibacter histidini]
MKFENSSSFARKLDQQDPLRSFRSRFLLPRVNGKTALYFTGNSLGLQPKTTKNFVNEELEDWAKLGVEGHVHARRPWLYYHKFTKKALARLTGAKPSEVVAMNQLTVNLHLMLVSFYNPTKERFKILTEHGAFSSDQYAFETQLKFHGHDPEQALIELKPRPGETVLRTEDILEAITTHGPQLALVIFGGVQYYTGQFFDLKKITEAAHRAGAMAGFDLAHAIGNVPLNLHKDDVDFAVWCSYKYLNAGPGAIAGAFVHECHAKNAALPRFAGWWGHNEAERFQMKKGFQPIAGADGWQVSNVPILQSAALLASLEIFEEASIKNLRAKSELLTGYLEFILREIDPARQHFELLTPVNPKERGCQLSVFMKQNGKKIFRKLTAAGVIADWREPDVIRVAPVPLYNTFEDVWRLGDILRQIVV